jgi:hypothetical protein
MGEAKKSFLLRLDPRLWAEVQAWADDELRSVNGQIEFVLRQAVAARRKGRPPPRPPNRLGNSTRCANKPQIDES